MEEGKGVRHVPISETIETFLAEQRARALTESTLRKLRTLTAALSDFCKSRNIANISQLNIDRVRQFRVSWKDSPIPALKKLERTRSFFKFCVDSGWLKGNPAKPLKSPIVADPPTLPFTDAEVEKIIKHATGKWRTFVLLPVNSGLRIGDAMKLTPAEIADGRLFLYMQKTRVPVCVPLPDFLLHELRQLPLEGGYYFWKREPGSKLETASGNARRAFRQICKDAKVINGHPHRFRVKRGEIWRIDSHRDVVLAKSVSQYASAYKPAQARTRVHTFEPQGLPQQCGHLLRKAKPERTQCCQHPAVLFVHNLDGVKGRFKRYV